MSNLFKKLRKGVKHQDYFAHDVTFTFKGEESFKSLLGGVLTILIVLGFAAQTSYGVHKLYAEPSYNHSPSTYNYTATNTTFQLNTRSNKVAFTIESDLSPSKLW